MALTNKNKEKKYFIESISNTEYIKDVELLYDANSNNATLIDVKNGDRYYNWVDYNIYQQIDTQYKIDDFDIISINSRVYKDYINPGTLRILVNNEDNPTVLSFTDWNKDSLGPVFSITGVDSLTGSLSSTVSGTTTQGFTVDMLFRPYISQNEKCLFHRWTTKNGGVYDKFNDSIFSINNGNNLWGVGAFFGIDTYGKYIDFFIYGDNTYTFTGTISAYRNYSPSLSAETVTGTATIISNSFGNDFKFALQHDYIVDDTPWPIIYECDIDSNIPGTLGGTIQYTIDGASTGTFTGNMSYDFYNYSSGTIANSVDTRYYLPNDIDIYDGSFHRLQFVWSIDDSPNGVVYFDGEELVNKQVYGDGRKTSISYNIDNSICATPFSIFGFIEAGDIGNTSNYNESYNTFFGELKNFIMYDINLPEQTIHNLAGGTVINNQPVYYDPFNGAINDLGSSYHNNAARVVFYSTIYQYKDNVVLYFNSDDYLGNNELVDRATRYGSQNSIEVGHIGKIYQKSLEGQFNKCYDIIFDTTDEGNIIPSSYDYSITGNNSQIVTIHNISKVFKKDGISIYNKYYNNDTYIGYVNYSNGIVLINKGLVSGLNAVILESVYEKYNKKVNIDIDGEFFTRSMNGSGWYQQGINNVLPKSPTKYINGIVVYDQDSQPMFIAKFPVPIKKTIYDDIRISLEL